MLSDGVLAAAGLAVIALLIAVVVLMSLMLKEIRHLCCFTRDAHVELDIKFEWARKRLAETIGDAVVDAMQLRRENLWRNAAHAGHDRPRTSRLKPAAAPAAEPAGGHGGHSGRRFNGGALRTGAGEK
jgi:hypothetical protein